MKCPEKLDTFRDNFYLCEYQSIVENLRAIV